MTMNARILWVICAAIILTGAAARLDAEQSITAARDLYASAAYDDALTMLNGLAGASHTRADRQTIGVYRVLCLMALGRAPEAQAAIDAVIAQDPFARPALDDLPPRMRTAFTDARKRMLPAFVQQQYATAKAAFDRGEFAAAAPAFKQVIDALEDSDLGHAAKQSPLADVRTLASGFHDLSVKALAPPPPAPVAAVAPPPAPTRDYRRLYTPDDRDVVPPTVVRQTFPPFPGKVLAPGVGLLELVIDATGAIDSVTMTVPLHPQYDKMVVGAAKKWQYQPATLDGVPVKYLKRVQVSLTASPAAP
jgi:hypothetical protein